MIFSGKTSNRPPFEGLRISTLPWGLLALLELSLLLAFPRELVRESPDAFVYSCLWVMLTGSVLGRNVPIPLFISRVGECRETRQLNNHSYLGSWKGSRCVMWKRCRFAQTFVLLIHSGKKI